MRQQRRARCKKQQMLVGRIKGGEVLNFIILVRATFSTSQFFLNFNSVINYITSFCVSNESNDNYGIKSLIFSPIQKNFTDGY